MKPSVQHFRVFGRIAYSHVLDSQRKKLDDKSIKCILIGLSQKSKAYKLYNLKSKKFMIRRDVIFEESQGWNWNGVENTQRSRIMIDDNVIEFTNDVLVNEIDPEMPHLEDISETTSSGMKIVLLIMK